MKSTSPTIHRLRAPGAFLKVSLAVFLAASCTVGSSEHPVSLDASPSEYQAGPVRHRAQMGINYNGQFRFIDFSDIERTQTTWVRGFMDLFQYEDDPQLANEQIGYYRQLKDNGYQTLLNIKFNFHGKSFPAPGSDEIQRHKRMLGRLLDRVWDKTDIIVIGNEPFIESIPAERDERLVRYYRQMTRFAIDYRKGKPRKLPIYVGSFQNLNERARRQNPGTRGLLAFAKNTPALAGVDLHIHHDDLQDIPSAIRFAHDRIREDQRIIISEFSLMHHWRKKMGEPIPASFAREYGLATDMRNFEYIDEALKDNVPRTQWVAFLSDSYWFENRKRYLRNSFQHMASFPKFFLATYGIRQSYPPNRTFTVNDDPWILNAIYANRTVTNPDGRTRFNYAWIDDFRAIQKGEIR